MDTHSSSVRVAALGDYESVLPFQAIGVETVVVEADATEETVRAALLRVRREQVGILFLTEDLFARHRDVVDELNEQTSMTIIPIPDQSGTVGIGMESVRKCVEKAVGMDIFAVQ